MGFDRMPRYVRCVELVSGERERRRRYGCLGCFGKDIREGDIDTGNAIPIREGAYRYFPRPRDGTRP